MLYDYQRGYKADDSYRQIGYSQFGEDIALWSWLETLKLTQSKGFYIDVGAHHPIKGSNTKLVRDLLGWTGINIEPDPNLFAEFVASLPDCINLQVAVGGKRETTELTVYNHPGVNTISEQTRLQQSQRGHLKAVDTIQVEVYPLNEIVETHMPSGADFLLLTIDAEGVDFDVITSLNLDKYRPKLIMIEDFEFDLCRPENSKIYNHLRASDYLPASHCMVTTIYRDLR